MRSKFILIVLLPLFVFSQKREEKKFSTRIVKDIKADYVIAYPENYKKSKHNWPLILFLHGAGERGNDLSKVALHGPLKYIDEGHQIPAIILAPQCPVDEVWDKDMLYNLLKEVVIKEKVDFSRIYITGLSMGGYGTWDMALEHPELFAAVAPVCAPVGLSFKPRIHNLKNKPVWVFHGAKDKVVPVKNSEDMVKLLRNIGGNPKLTIYPDAGHDSWTQTYNNPDFYNWLFSHEQELPSVKTIQR